MKESRLSYVMLLVVSTGVGAFGQLFLKIGVSSDVRIYFLSWIAIGVIAYALSWVLYLFVLSTTNLSWAYGFAGLGYVFASVLAFAFLGEQVPPLRWFGIAVISLGTLLVGIS